MSLLSTLAKAFGSSKFGLTAGRRRKTTLTGVNYTILPTDEVITVTVNNLTITAPANPVEGDEYYLRSFVTGGAGTQINFAGNGKNIAQGNATVAGPTTIPVNGGFQGGVRVLFSNGLWIVNYG